MNPTSIIPRQTLFLMLKNPRSASKTVMDVNRARDGITDFSRSDWERLGGETVSNRHLRDGAPAHCRSYAIPA